MQILFIMPVLKLSRCTVYARTKHLPGKGNTQTQHKGSHIYTVFGPIVNLHKVVKSQHKVFQEDNILVLN